MKFSRRLSETDVRRQCQRRLEFVPKFLTTTTSWFFVLFCVDYLFIYFLCWHSSTMTHWKVARRDMLSPSEILYATPRRDIKVTKGYKSKLGKGKMVIIKNRIATVGHATSPDRDETPVNCFSSPCCAKEKIFAYWTAKRKRQKGKSLRCQWSKKYQ